jgi:regulator of replication initiation timing
MMDSDTVMKMQASLPFGERNGEQDFAHKEPEPVMVYEEEFGRLEQFVEKLIDSYNELKAENGSLRQQLAETEQQNLQNKDLVSNLQNDRTIMHKRVTHLIGKIDEWEKSHHPADDAQEILPDKKTGSKTAVTTDPTFSLAVD